MIRFAALLLTPLLALAQLTPNSVTVTASRPSAGQPDTARFNVAVSSPASATREEVVAVVAGAGVTAAGFTGVNSYNSGSALSVTWNFSMTAPLTSLKATVALLTAVQNNLATEKKYSLSFSVSAGEVSGGDCKLQELIADARSQAARLASAAGMSVGAIQAINGSTASAAATASGIASAATVSSPACSITVRFGLAGGL